MTIAFDVDGTLIGISDDSPRYEIIPMFLTFQKLKWTMYIWSGGGCDYAQKWADKLGLQATIIEKGSMRPDIAVDDMIVRLGTVNIKV